ncbi:MAG: MopE-related protein [Sandaracinus sp.]
MSSSRSWTSVRASGPARTPRVATLGALALWAAACSTPTETPDAAADAMRDTGPTVCTSDRDCADAIFCNGIERCMPTSARAGDDGCVPSTSPPCPAGTACDETGGRCATLCGTTMDADGDGVTSIDCGGDDCDDADPLRYPSASETCDASHDEDCDPTTVGTRDEDGDGATSSACCNGMVCGPDCDDTLGSVHPGAGEVCNDRDDDCDTAIDEGVRASYWVDADHDLYGDATSAPHFACAPATGEVQNALDCDDASAGVHPGALELCNGVDDDCDGVDDNTEQTARECAATYGSPAFTTFTCASATCTLHCNADHFDCDGRLDDGCETDGLTTAEHCGSCERSCGAVGTCANGACDPIVALSAGGLHSCIVRASGVVACWGQNTYAQLGDQTFTTRRDPVRATGLGSATLIEAAGTFASGQTCATGGDTVLCWGANSLGQLGDGTTTSRLAPTPVTHYPPNTNLFTPGHTYALAGSGLHTCAIAEGSMVFDPAHPRLVWCWGSNDNGQLGRGSTTPAIIPTPDNSPTPVPLDVGARVAASLRGTCVTTGTRGQVYCVGGNALGGLGKGNTSPSASWVRAGTLADVIAIDGSVDTFCAVSETQGVSCWGAALTMARSPTPTPTPVSISGRVVDVQVGATFASLTPFACALRDDGTVACWGGNDDGNLGRGTTTPSESVPMDVTGLDHVTQLSIGGFHACAVRDDGAVWCWGSNAMSQLGNASAGMRSAVPVRVDRLPPYLP